MSRFMLRSSNTNAGNMVRYERIVHQNGGDKEHWVSSIYASTFEKKINSLKELELTWNLRVLISEFFFALGTLYSTKPWIPSDNLGRTSTVMMVAKIRS